MAEVQIRERDPLVCLLLVGLIPRPPGQSKYLQLLVAGNEDLAIGHYRDQIRIAP